MPKGIEERPAPVLIRASELVARQLADHGSTARARGDDGVLNLYFTLRAAYDGKLWRDVLTDLTQMQQGIE